MAASVAGQRSTAGVGTSLCDRRRLIAPCNLISQVVVLPLNQFGQTTLAES